MSKKYTQKDFIFEEDFILSAECEDCGHVTDNENEFDRDCPECGGYLINETSHEGESCSICNHTIDMWEDAYRHRDDHETLICKNCYEDLEED